MRLALVLAVLPALAAAEPAKKLDLSGLLGGPSAPPGPSGSSEDGRNPARQALLAAIEELTRTHAAATVGHFERSLAKRDMAGDERNPDAQDLARAADLARTLIREK